MSLTPLPWSPSSLSDFRNCPKQFYEVRIAKRFVKDYGAEAAYGTYVHKCFEDYLNAGTPLPADVQHWQKYIDKIRDLPGERKAESRYAIDKNLQPCSFFAKSVWCRCIIDTVHLDGTVSLAVDHKTGKKKEDSDQLKLCALMVFIHHPQIETCHTRFEWLKTGEHTAQVYTRDQMPQMWAGFVPSLEQYVFAFKNEMFGPRPSGLCNGWCPVTDCEFYKPKREY